MKKYPLTTTAALILVLPPAAYFIISLYAWLFFGVDADGNRVYAGLLMAIAMTALVCMIRLAEDERGAK